MRQYDQGATMLEECTETPHKKGRLRSVPDYQKTR